MNFSLSIRVAPFFLALSGGLHADTFYVDAALATGANDGSSWADAFRGAGGLQAAFLGAGSSDQIYVREGSYLPSITGVRTASFVMESGLEVYGGFLGTESSPAERPPFGSAPTILQGDLQGDDAQNGFSDNSYHVVDGSSVNSTAILDGFVVTGGVADGGGVDEDGGGGLICIDFGSPTIRECVFENNFCNLFGGAAHIKEGSSPTFLHCEFKDNYSLQSGGGINLFEASGSSLDRCIFSGNEAGRGSAIYIFESDQVRVTNCLVRDNTGSGGFYEAAIVVNRSNQCLIRNCTIVDNLSIFSSVAGVETVAGPSPMVSNCILWGNALDDGGQGPLVQADANVSYSIIMNGPNANGNSPADPLFVNAASNDFSLSPNSPAIDSGNNDGLLPGLLLDLAGNPRYVDVLTVADTGVGTAPIVDKGAFEASDLTFVPFCFGDGSGTQCPCGNNSAAGHLGGCAHQDGEGGVLIASGVPSFVADTLHFDLSSAAANSFGRLLSGINQLPQVGSCVGCGLQAFDGLRCAGGNFLRHGLRPVDGGGNATGGWGCPAGPGGGLIAAGGLVAGQTRHFFAFFRTGLMETCGSGRNSSNGVSVTFLP